MNMELKLQALADGELDASEIREIEAILAQDGQGGALMQELKWTKAAVAGNEVEVKLPESREFYWSKISRAIEAGEKRDAAPLSGRVWWLKFLYPAAGLAAMVAVMFVLSGGRTTDGSDSESVPEDVDAVSFRSETQGMSVVYVADEGGNFSPVGQEVKNDSEADN